MELTQSYRVVASSGRMVLDLPWLDFESGINPGKRIWACRLEGHEADLLSSLFNIAPASRKRLGYLPGLSEVIGAPTEVIQLAPDLLMLKVEETDSVRDEPPSSVDLTDLYNEKVQQAAEEMGVEWQPGQEIPGELMWYMHG